MCVPLSARGAASHPHKRCSRARSRCALSSSLCSYHFFTFILVFLEVRAERESAQNSRAHSSCLLQQKGAVEATLASKPQQPHLFPVNLFVKPWKMGEEFLRMCKAGVLNYVIIRPLTALIAFICESNGVYKEGELFNPAAAYPYLVAVNSWTQMGALYSLFLLFKAARSELDAIRPVAKFVCVKAVVFFSFWQSARASLCLSAASQLLLLTPLVCPPPQIAIVVLVHMHVLTSRTLHLKDYDVKDVAAGTQELIICVEMFVAACAHQIAFPASDFASYARTPEPGGAAPTKLSSVLDVLDMSDVVSDVGGALKAEARVMRDRLPTLPTFKLPGMGGKARAPSGVKAKGEEGVGLLGEAGEGGAGGDEQVGRLNASGFITGSSHQRRTPGAGDVGTDVQAVALTNTLSPRAVAAAAAAAASTSVSIGGREVELREIVTAAGPLPSALADEEAAPE